MSAFVSLKGLRESESDRLEVNHLKSQFLNFRLGVLFSNHFQLRRNYTAVSGLEKYLFIMNF